MEQAQHRQLIIEYFLFYLLDITSIGSIRVLIARDIFWREKEYLQKDL